MASGLGEIGRGSLKWTKLIWFVGLTPMSRYNAPSLRKLVGSNMRGAVKRPLITSTLCVIMDEMGVLLGDLDSRVEELEYHVESAIRWRCWRKWLRIQQVELA